MAVIVLFEDTIQNAYKHYLEEFNHSLTNIPPQVNSLAGQDKSHSNSSNIKTQGSKTSLQFQESPALIVSKRDYRNPNDEIKTSINFENKDPDAATENSVESNLSQESSTATIETNTETTASVSDTFPDFYEGFFIGDMTIYFTPRDNLKMKPTPENYISGTPDSRDASSRKISENYSSFSDNISNERTKLQIQNSNVNWKTSSLSMQPVIPQIFGGYSNNSSFTPPTFDLDSIRKGNITQSPPINANQKLMQFPYNNSPPFLFNPYYQMQGISNTGHINPLPQTNNWQYPPISAMFSSSSNNQPHNTMMNQSSVENNNYNNHETIIYSPNPQKRLSDSIKSNNRNEINNLESSGNYQGIDNDVFNENSFTKLHKEILMSPSLLDLQNKNPSPVFFPTTIITPQISNPIGNGYNNGGELYRKYDSNKSLFAKDKYYDKPKLPPRFQRSKAKAFYEPTNN